MPDAFSVYQVDLICRLIGALIQMHSVNLKKLATALSGSAQIDSHYRRLQLFFSSDLSTPYATYLRQQGVPLDLVQKLIGHKSPLATADNYDHSIALHFRKQAGLVNFE